jgi:hypothetical protein
MEEFDYSLFVNEWWTLVNQFSRCIHQKENEKKMPNSNMDGIAGIEEDKWR